MSDTLTEHTNARERCCNCGATADLVQRQDYVGGDGYRWFTECRDKPACWQRRDVKLGVVSWGE